MKTKLPYILLLILLGAFSVHAKFEYKDKDIKTLVDKGAILSQTYLAADQNSKKGLTLLQFVRAHNPYHPIVGLLDNAIEFKREINKPKRLTSSRSYASFLYKKALKIKKLEASDEQMYLYFYISSLLDSSQKNARKEVNKLKKTGVDPSKDLTFFLESLPEEMVTEVEDEVKPTVIINETPTPKKSSPVSKKEKEDAYARYKKAPLEQIKSVLGEYHFETFRYSRVTVLDAINQLTHRLLPFDIKLSFKSNRISVMEEKKALNGATFYYGPLLPRYDGYDFSLSDTYFRDVIGHVCINNDLDYLMRDGQIKLKDLKYHYIDGMPQDGWDIQTLYPRFKESYVKTKKIFEKKFVKINAYATGITLKKSSNKFASINLNSNGAALELREGYYDEDVLNSLAKEISSLKAEGSLEIPGEVRMSIKDKEERAKGKNKWNSSVELVFFAKIKAFDRSKGILLEFPRFAYWKSRGTFLTVRYPSEKEKDAAKERQRL